MIASLNQGTSERYMKFVLQHQGQEMIDEAGECHEVSAQEYHRLNNYVLFYWVNQVTDKTKPKR